MIKTLKDTTELMNSTDYRERFIAEYNQLVIRYRGLRNILQKMDMSCLAQTFIRKMKNFKGLLVCVMQLIWY